VHLIGLVLGNGPDTGSSLFTGSGLSPGRSFFVGSGKWICIQWGRLLVTIASMNDDLGKRFIDEVNANPIPEDLFLELVSVAIDALKGRRRELPHDSERIMESPGVYLTDVPMNQLGLSIVRDCHERFPNDMAMARSMSQSFLFRWFALENARDDSEFGEFVRSSDEPGSEMIHSAIFKAAAACPLTTGGSGLFDDSFYLRARALKASDDAESSKDDVE
jgi:hypothetical protein